MIPGSLRIDFQDNGLKARITGDAVSDLVWLQVKIVLSSGGSEEIRTGPSQEIEMPWSDFRRVLQPFAILTRAERVTIVYSDRARQLIEEHVQDTLSLKNSIPPADVTAFEPTILESGFRRRLNQEQLRDSERLIRMRHGANFSVPGSGKTTTLLAVHIFLRNRGDLSKLLVVSPRNAFISWESEIDQCLEKDSVTVLRLTGGKDKIRELLAQDPEVALVTYQQLPIVLDEVLSFILRNKTHLVLDESHRIKKGYPGVFFSAVARIADFAVRRDVMSGTPMPQSVIDLVPQFDFLWPGTDLLSETTKIPDTEEKIERTSVRLRNHFVRTTKGELALPPPITTVTNVKLGLIQQEIYQLLRSEAARIAAGMGRDEIGRYRLLGRQVMRLLQAASNPALISSSSEYPEELSPIPPGSRAWELLSEFSKYERPAKVEYALRRVRELASLGKKVVVWSAFVRNVQLLESKLSDLGAVSIYGAIETGDENDAETREWRLREFHESEDCRVLIANPAAGGEGISLHKVCHNAIYLDRTFNAAHYLQSVDRIHRLGLDRNARTDVEIIQAEDTIDMVVESRVNEKIRAMAAVLDDKDLRALAYDPFDVIEENPAGIERGDESPILNHLKES